MSPALKKEIEEERPPIEMARPPRPGFSRRRPRRRLPGACAAGRAGGARGAAAAGDAAARRDGAACAGARSGGRAARAGAGQRCPDADQLGRDADESRPLTQKVWFWVAVGAGAVVLTTVLLLATRSETFPDANVRNGERELTCAR